MKTYKVNEVTANFPSVYELICHVQENPELYFPDYDFMYPKNGDSPVEYYQYDAEPEELDADEIERGYLPRKSGFYTTINGEYLGNYIHITPSGVQVSRINTMENVTIFAANETFYNIYEGRNAYNLLHQCDSLAEALDRVESNSIDCEAGDRIEVYETVYLDGSQVSCKLVYTHIMPEMVWVAGNYDTPGYYEERPYNDVQDCITD